MVEENESIPSIDERAALPGDLIGLISRDIDIYHASSEKLPLLAHYTTIATAEQILKYRTIWLSNPLLMNDSQELTYGVSLAGRMARRHKALNLALGSDAKQSLFFYGMFREYEQLITLDVENLYVACFCKHEKQDGILSMWRS